MGVVLGRMEAYHGRGGECGERVEMMMNDTMALNSWRYGLADAKYRRCFLGR